MVIHDELTYVIDPTGRARAEINTNPGPSTGATSSSFSQTLAGTLKQALGSA